MQDCEFGRRLSLPDENDPKMPEKRIRIGWSELLLVKILKVYTMNSQSIETEGTRWNIHNKEVFKVGGVQIKESRGKNVQIKEGLQKNFFYITLKKSRIFSDLGILKMLLTLLHSRLEWGR